MIFRSLLAAPAMLLVALPARAEPPTPLALPLMERPRLQAGLASVFAIGDAPVVVGGVTGFLGLRWKNVSLALEESVLFAPSAKIDDFHIHDGYQYLVASIAGSACFHGRWVFGCVRIEVGSLSIRNSNVDVVPERTGSFGVGHRFGREWVLTPGLALRAYGDLLVRPLGGLSLDGATRFVLWPGSALSVSLGFGPVFSFSTL
jgi:hypothetical protein